MPHRKLHGKPLEAYLLSLDGEFGTCREFMHMLPVPAWMLDARARFMYMNPRARKFFRVGDQELGLTAAEMGFLTLDELVKIRAEVHDLQRRHHSCISFRELRFEHEPTKRFTVLRFPIWADNEAFFAGAIAVPFGG